MKKLILLLFLVLLFFTVMEAKTIQVGFIATNFAAESQARVGKAFEAYAKGLGWKPIMLNSRGSIETQANQVEDLVQMHVDAIVLAMGHPAEIRPALDKAIKEGIPVITIDSGYVDGVVADITTDNYVMGAKISTYFIDALGGQGNIIVFKFVKHAGCRRRGKVLDVELSENPGIKVLAEHTVAATKKFMEDTRSAMETFVTRFGHKIDGVWCAFDQLGYAISDVLQEHGYNNVVVVGIDGNAETFRRISEATFTATIAQPFEGMAKKAIELIRAIVVEGKTPKEAAPRKTIYMDAPLIDKTNVPAE